MQDVNNYDKINRIVWPVLFAASRETESSKTLAFNHSYTSFCLFLVSKVPCYTKPEGHSVGASETVIFLWLTHPIIKVAFSRILSKRIVGVVGIILRAEIDVLYFGLSVLPRNIAGWIEALLEGDGAPSTKPPLWWHRVFRCDEHSTTTMPTEPR